MENKGSAIETIGWIVIAVGIIISGYLVVQFSKAGLFSSSGDLSFNEIVIIIGVAFYHIVLGVLCLSVSSIQFTLEAIDYRLTKKDSGSQSSSIRDLKDWTSVSEAEKERFLKEDR